MPSTIGGRIKTWQVREGQLVQKGDTLAEIAEIKDKYFDPELLARTREQLEAKIASLRENAAKTGALGEQQDALRDALAASLAKARNKVRQSDLKVRSTEAELVATRPTTTLPRRSLSASSTCITKG